MSILFIHKSAGLKVKTYSILYQEYIGELANLSANYVRNFTHNLIIVKIVTCLLAYTGN